MCINIYVQQAAAGVDAQRVGAPEARHSGPHAQVYLEAREYFLAMSGFATELFPSWNDVVARREWEVGFAMERLEKMEVVDLPLCRIERISA